MATLGVGSEMAGPPGPTAEAQGPPAHRVRRWAARIVGGAVLLLGMGLVAASPSNSVGNLVVGLLLYLPALALLCSPWARRRQDTPVGHLRARRIVRSILAACGAAALVWGAVLATETTHPVSPAILSGRTNCGSAVLPRRFPQVDAKALRHASPAQLRLDFDLSLISNQSGSECGDGVHQNQSEALWLLPGGLLLLWATLLRPLPTGAPPPSPVDPADGRSEPEAPPTGTERRRMTTHPWLAVGAVVAVALLLGGALALHTRSSLQVAEKTDQEAAAWLTTYPPRFTQLGVVAAVLAPALERRNYPVIVEECQRAVAVVDSLHDAANSLPGAMGTELPSDVRQFVARAHDAFAACVTGAQRHDWQYMKAHMLPALDATKAPLAQILRLGVYR
jgi:hypothetical protein